MKTHELKTDPEFFELFRLGKKTAELRYDDRGYEVGDWLVLREYDRNTQAYSGRVDRFIVCHVLRDFPGLVHGWVMLSIQKGDDS